MPYKNIEEHYAQQARHRQKNFELLWQLLLHSSCLDCTITNPLVLEFDHMPGFEKKFDIARAVSGSTRSWKAIQKEIDKCEIVCANCHRIRTMTRGKHKRFIASLFSSVD